MILNSTLVNGQNITKFRLVAKGHNWTYVEFYQTMELDKHIVIRLSNECYGNINIYKEIQPGNVPEDKTAVFEFSALS